MRRGFLRTRKRAPGAWLFRILMAGVILGLIGWVFVSVNPFQPLNPFFHKVTIGQTVIGDWRYGGTDPTSGAIKFYDTYQSVPIPGDSHTFAADGEFVNIEGHTATTLTFEPVYESEIFGPAIYLWLFFLFAAITIFIWRTKISSGMRWPLTQRKSAKIRKRSHRHLYHR